MTTNTATPLVPVHKNSSLYRLAFQARNGCAKLYKIELFDLDNGRDVMMKLRSKSKGIMPSSLFFGGLWKVVIETAVVEPVHIPPLTNSWYNSFISGSPATNIISPKINGTNLDSQVPIEVNLRENTFNPWLTQAFHDPSTLSQAPDFSDFNIASDNNNSPVKTLVIRTTINKSVILLLLFFTAVFACVMGIVVGILTSRAELGFGVACAVFALITLVQGLVIAYMRELGERK
ncbi:hypothetical protein K440DRAFT_675786 [Wilcoxina mikolae CBS 423.85]|nr:hypothetical protein K440DRAFT_675786 [Wilcoxina mikolae CBS 423.85]